MLTSLTRRHCRACPGHPRLCGKNKTWMPGTRPGMTSTTGATRSLVARYVQARVKESQRRFCDQCMDAAAIDARSVDAGLREFIFAILVALVDEDVVIDPARNHVKLGARDVPGRELGIVPRRRLGIAGTDCNIGRHLELPQSGCIHAEGLHDAGRHG